jgi:hypothetical protein
MSLDGTEQTFLAFSGFQVLNVSILEDFSFPSTGGLVGGAQRLLQQRELGIGWSMVTMKT